MITTHDQHLSRFYSVLSSPVRVCLLRRMVQAGECTVAKMEEYLDFGLEQPTISHHLKIMRRAGIVGYRRHGTYHHYFCSCPELVTRLLSTSNDVEEDY
jgi:ArsR family transcriptional regulator